MCFEPIKGDKILYIRNLVLVDPAYLCAKLLLSIYCSQAEKNLSTQSRKCYGLFSLSDLFPFRTFLNKYATPIYNTNSNYYFEK